MTEIQDIAIAGAQEFPTASVGAIALLKKLLMYDPAQRLSARAALRHGYFQEQPPPKQPADFPTFPSAHDTGLRQRHQRRWCPKISPGKRSVHKGTPCCYSR